MIKKKSEKLMSGIIANLILMIATVLCILPFITVLSASISNEQQLIDVGYGILPRGLSLDAYKVVFANSKQVIDAYIVTIIVTVVGAVAGTLIMAMAAFAIARKDYVWRKIANFYIYFTMIFSGGAVSSYLWITQGLHLKNNILVLILPLLVSGWNIFLLRTYISKIPMEIIEATKIDGASEFKIFFKIILPMSTVGLATILVMTTLAYWNQWYACLMYISNDKYTTLQYYLMRVMNNINSILNAQSSQAMMIDTSNLPGETARMAMCVVSAGPMIFVFMFFQKYFVGGLALGSVKG